MINKKYIYFLVLFFSLGFSQEEPPGLFQYNQSTLQAFYFINSANIYGEPLVVGQDWIGVFKNNICVGSYPWQGEGNYTTVPAMGYDGSDYTEGYMTAGDIPIFKIYDASENIYYNAISSSGCVDDLNQPIECGWSNFGFYNIPFLDLSVQMSIPLHYQNNLISFYTLPNNTNISNIVTNIENNLLGIVGEGIAAQNNNGVWTGSLVEFDTYSGYWLRMSSDNDTLIVEGSTPDPSRVYQLHSGLNLISFPTSGSVTIPDGIDDSIEDEIPFVIGESKATAQVNGQWVGSLTEFEGGRGYWINSNIDLDFQYNIENLSLSRTNNMNIIDNHFSFNQSQSQSFYFMTLDELSALDINIGDWIIAYNDNLIVGARQWNGNIVDVPVMGYDGFENTTGYCNTEDTPNFKVYSLANDELLDISSDYIPSFTSNSIVYLEEVKSKTTNAFTPSDYNIISTYPNPFNPETTIKFSIPNDSEVSIVIYNLHGEKVTSLINENYQPGYYSITWDASQYSSGIYFVNMTAKNFTTTQKLILVK